MTSLSYKKTCTFIYLHTSAAKTKPTGHEVFRGAGELRAKLMQLLRSSQKKVEKSLDGHLGSTTFSTC